MTVQSKPKHDVIDPNSKHADYIKGMLSWARWTLGIGIMLVIFSLLEFSLYQDPLFRLNFAVSMLGEGLLLILSGILLWKRSRWVLLSFGLFTLLTIISPLITEMGYDMWDLLLLIFPMAFFSAMRNFWTLGLFSHQSPVKSLIEA